MSGQIFRHDRLPVRSDMCEKKKGFHLYTQTCELQFGAVSGLKLVLWDHLLIEQNACGCLPSVKMRMYIRELLFSLLFTAVTEAGKVGDDLAKSFFWEEYTLNHYTGT